MAGNYVVVIGACWRPIGVKEIVLVAGGNERCHVVRPSKARQQAFLFARRTHARQAHVKEA